MNPDTSIQVIRLRGHHLLCLHGFRGLGYSPEFASNMARIRRHLIDRPKTLVELTDSPDDICDLCPHHSERKCRKSNDSETRAREKDLVVLRKLSLSIGDILPSNRIFALITERFKSGIDDLCSKCRWFSLGWCSQGIRESAMTNISDE